MKQFTIADQGTGVKVSRLFNPQRREPDMKPERIKWKRTKGRQQLLLNKIYDAVTDEFSRDAMASLATVLAHLCIATNIARPAALDAFGNAYDQTRDMISGSAVNPSLLN